MFNRILEQSTIRTRTVADNITAEEMVELLNFEQDKGWRLSSVSKKEDGRMEIRYSKQCGEDYLEKQ